MQKKFHKYLLCRPKFKCCQPIEGDKQRKRIVFGAIQSKAELEDFNGSLKLLNKDKNEDAPQVEVADEFKLELSYENYNMSEALKLILPELEDQEIPSGFEIIGDIAHLNL